MVVAVVIVVVSTSIVGISVLVVIVVMVAVLGSSSISIVIIVIIVVVVVVNATVFACVSGSFHSVDNVFLESHAFDESSFDVKLWNFMLFPKLRQCDVFQSQVHP